MVRVVRINVDDEGNHTERTVLVENGVLRSYMHDELSAKHYGITPHWIGTSSELPTCTAHRE